MSRYSAFLHSTLQVNTSTHLRCHVDVKPCEFTCGFAGTSLRCRIAKASFTTARAEKHNQRYLGTAMGIFGLGASPTYDVLLRRELRTGIPVVHVQGLSESWFRRPSVLGLLLFLAILLSRLFVRFLNWRLLKTAYARPKLNDDIAEFYNATSKAWEEVWGDHMHHGLYFGRGGKKVKRMRGRDAQIETIEELLRLGGLDQGSNLSDDIANKSNIEILDVGCGIGGASRFLARRFQNAKVTGITLSNVQAQRATTLNHEAGLEDRVQNIVLDVLNMKFPDDSFDIVWSMESAEHIPDKHLFISELLRVLKPGGTLFMLAWCLRESFPPLLLNDRASIRRIMTAYCLPRLAPPSEYSSLMSRLGFCQGIQEDWTERAAPFWGEVVRSSFLSARGWQTLAKYGMPLIRSALAMRFVISAIRRGCFRLVAFTAKKPTPAEAEEKKRKVAALRAGC